MPCGVAVYPIALFSYDKPKTAEKSRYEVSFPDKKVVEFNFAVIQLNQLNWRDFLNKDNAIASALMAKMGIEGADRVTAKKECLRMIARLRIDAARTHLLSGFVDSYLTLLAQERQKLESELKKLPDQEREEVMEITTSWKEEGKIEILCVLLKAKFGDVNKTIQNQLKKLSTEQITEFSKAFLNFTSEKDAEFWLKSVSRNR